MTTNYPKGLTNNTAQNVLGSLKTVDPTIYHTYFDDFDTYTAGDWTVTETGVATQALTNADGGVLLVTNAAADNDASFSQKVGESFLITTGKEAYFKARFKISDATQSDFVIGLQITDTTPLAVSDGIYFRKDDGDASLDFVVMKNSTATTTSAIATVVDDTYLTVGFYFNGKDEIQYFAGTNSLNPTLLGKSAITNLPDDEELTISFGIQNGEAVAKTMSIDYIFAAKAR
tara:strand:+ start:333 stop:1025 length:693 start_codon:yes stop_codon:yes gene_type:complete